MCTSSYLNLTKFTDNYKKKLQRYAAIIPPLKQRINRKILPFGFNTTKNTFDKRSMKQIRMNQTQVSIKRLKTQQKNLWRTSQTPKKRDKLNIKSLLKIKQDSQKFQSDRLRRDPFYKIQKLRKGKNVESTYLTSNFQLFQQFNQNKSVCLELNDQKQPKLQKSIKKNVKNKIKIDSSNKLSQFYEDIKSYFENKYAKNT